MDKAELETYYSDRFEMFTSDGWKALIEDIEQMKATTDTVAGVNTEADLHFRKGELSMQNWMLGLQGMSEAVYAGLKEEA